MKGFKKYVLENHPDPDNLFCKPTEEVWEQICKLADDYKKDDVSTRNILMTDMNGVKITPGHKIVYQKGELHEATCDVVKKTDGVYLTNWSDDNETISVADFWHEPTDNKITEVLNPDYSY